MSKKTSAYRAYQLLQTLPVGSTTSVPDIMKKMPEFVTPPAVGHLLWVMTQEGYLRKTDNDRWAIMAKTRKFHEVHRFVGQPLTGTNKAPKSAIRQKAEAIVNNGSIDVIEDLLTAMAKAEPELRRLQKLDGKVKALIN